MRQYPHDKYKQAVDTHLTGMYWLDIVPYNCISPLLEISEAEGTDTTLLAVWWRRESSWCFYPPPNPRKGGGADMGPCQMANTIWNKSPFIDGLLQPFTDPRENLILCCRAFQMDIWRRATDRADAIGLLRAGNREAESYGHRVKQFQQVVEPYDRFFAELKS